MHANDTILRLYICGITQSPDSVLNFEIRMQSRDSENAQHNLEIAQILRLRGTYILKFSQGGYKVFHKGAKNLTTFL